MTYMCNIHGECVAEVLPFSFPPPQPLPSPANEKSDVVIRFPISPVKKKIENKDCLFGFPCNSFVVDEHQLTN